MDPTQIKKIQAMKVYKRRRFLSNLYFYSLTALTCSLICCVTLCLPCLSSLVRVFLFECIPTFISVLLGSKLLFIIGNLIIVALIVDSRIFSSNSSSTRDVYYDEYIKSSQAQKPEIPSLKVKKATKLEKHAAEIVDMTVEDGQQRLKGKGLVEGAVESSREEENLDEGGDPSSLSAPDDDLNKRAEDFIARVNRQRRLELSLLQYGSY